MYDEMKISGEKTANVINKLFDFIKPGISTEDIDIFCAENIKKENGISGCLNFHGFPKNVCISVNNKVCHGISSPKEIIPSSCIISVDCVVKYNNYFGDSCFSFIIGNLTEKQKRLVYSCYETMWETILKIKEGVTIGELSKTMENGAHKNGFDVVHEFSGHAIGSELHLLPNIPFYFNMKDPTMNIKLKAGMFITIEPMFTEGKRKIHLLNDGWTVVTNDGGWSSQFEHTIFVTSNGFEVLTYNKYDIEQKKPRSL